MPKDISLLIGKLVDNIYIIFENLEGTTISQSTHDYLMEKIKEAKEQLMKIEEELMKLPKRS